MQYYKCKCGEREYWGSGMSPPDCVGCEKCGTTLAGGPKGHKTPEPHEPMTLYDQNTGKPYQICKQCREKLPSE